MSGAAADVFVSYKAEDRPRAARLVAALEAEGFSVWWDTHIGGGAHWREDIEEHLDAAKCVIVVWTKRSTGPSGNFVRDEAARAQRRDAYLPVRLDPVEPPLGFGEVQALSLRGWKGDPADPRFRAVADAARACIAGEGIARHRHFHSEELRVSRRVAIAGGMGVAGIAAAGGGWLLFKPTAANAKRIAVMTFDDLSGDASQAYFAEGVAEELRGALARVGLQVIGRASSDAVKDMDTRAAAAKLGVANILTGSVRRSPEIVRVSAALVGGNDGVEHWEANYDRPAGDAIKIQTDIAQNVAQALSIALGQTARAALTLGGTADSAAQDLYLRATSLNYNSSTEDDYDEALSLTNVAIARDPNYAQAYRIKAVLLQNLTNYPKSPADAADKLAQAEAAARAAIAIAPRLGSAYATLAGIESFRFDFANAVQNMRHALALSPDVVPVISAAIQFAEYFGVGHQSVALADRLIALDPLDANSYAARGDAMYFGLRQYPQAIAAYRKALDLAPKLGNLRTQLASCHILTNRPAEAEAEYQAVPADDPLRLTGEAIMAARSRNLVGAEGVITHMRALFGSAASNQYAEIYAQAGDANRAFAELDNGVVAQDPGLQQLKIDPFLDPIRSDPRFPALLRRLNFPVWN